MIECQTDEWHIDVCVTGSQKALMLPPGLAFLSVSDKAWKKIDENPSPRLFYFDLKKYRDKLRNPRDPDTPFTPAHTLVRALRTSLKRIREEGIENVWARHARAAAATRAGMLALGLELFATQLAAYGVPVVHVDWRPPAGGDTRLASLLERLR